MAIQPSDSSGDKPVVDNAEGLPDAIIELHDRLIRRLFRAGLSLQYISEPAYDERIGTRIDDAVDEIDQSIRDMRNVIFNLDQSSNACSGPG